MKSGDCEICGTYLTPHKYEPFSRFERRKTCSRECYLKWCKIPENNGNFKGRMYRKCKYCEKKLSYPAKPKEHIPDYCLGCYNKVKREAHNKRPLINIFKNNLKENTALALEEVLIDVIGRKINKTGPLTNILKSGQNTDTLSRHPNKKDICERIGQTIKRNGSSAGKNNPAYNKFGKEHPAYGCKHSRESIEQRSKKSSEWMKGRYPGSKNNNAKQYVFYSPKGIEYIVHGRLKEFSKEHTLKSWKIGRLARQEIKEYEGWTLKI